MSGLMRPSVVGPMDEKLAMLSHRAATHAAQHYISRLRETEVAAGCLFCAQARCLYSA